LLEIIHKNLLQSFFKNEGVVMDEINLKIDGLEGILADP